MRDIFPEWTLDLGILKKNPIYYFFKIVAKYQYSVANIIGVQTSSNLKYLENWSKKPNRKLEVLNNWLSFLNEKKTRISLYICILESSGRPSDGLDSIWHKIADEISFNFPYELIKMVEYELGN